MVAATGADSSERVVLLLLEVDSLATGLRPALMRSKVASIRERGKDVDALCQALRLAISLEHDAASIADVSQRLDRACGELKLWCEKSRLDTTTRVAVQLLATLAGRLREATEVWATDSRPAED